MTTPPEVGFLKEKETLPRFERALFLPQQRRRIGIYIPRKASHPRLECVDISAGIFGVEMLPRVRIFFKKQPRPVKRQRWKARALAATTCSACENSLRETAAHLRHPSFLRTRATSKVSRELLLCFQHIYIYISDLESDMESWNAQKSTSPVASIVTRRCGCVPFRR